MVKYIENQTIRIFFILLIISTTICFLGCCNVRENITNHEDTKSDKPHENTISDKKDKDKDKDKKHDKNTILEKEKESFLDWSMYNTPVVNGYTPEWATQGMYPNLNQNLHSNQELYNPLGYSNRKQAFYNQGSYPNMSLPPQVIGCGGRNGPCLGGTQETVQVVHTPIEISERNIAPVNIMATPNDPSIVGVPFQVGVLYKVYGTLNEIFPLYGIRRYRNSDTWDYTTKVGKEGNFVYLKVLTKRVNNNELQTNDIVRLEGNSGKFRVTMYDSSYPAYNPYYR